MLPTDNRLTKDRDITSVKKKGELYNSESFSIVALKTKTSQSSRFAFVISTKVSPNATIRNKVKRALRQGVRQNLVFMRTGFDCVFLAKPISARKYTDEMMKEVGDALGRANLLK